MAILEEMKHIFLEALEKESDDEREAYLNKACRDDPRLRMEVDALLKGHFRTDSFVKGPILDPQMSSENTSLPDTIGAVRIPDHVSTIAAVNTGVDLFSIFFQLQKRPTSS